VELHFLTTSPLFAGMREEEIRPVLQCLGAQWRKFLKGETIFRAGTTVQAMGIVLSGRASIESSGLRGRRNVLSSLGPGAVFAETYACLPEEVLMVSVVAEEDSVILFLEVGRLLKETGRCRNQEAILRNLLAVTAQKNLDLSRRMEHIAPKTIRERVLSYLSFQAARQGTYDIVIPFDRQQLADYLNVDRSALSGELSKMQREGLLRVKKNRFFLEKGEGEAAYGIRLGIGTKQQKHKKDIG